jgi:chaperone required for assembly of F1-ATPase
MSGWTAKRFWKEVTVEETEGSFTIRLDARPLRTPAKSAVTIPTRTMAEAAAAEWRAVDKKTDPRVMPVTRAINAAIDKVAPQFDEVAALIAAYGASDLLCYRAESPPELAQAQAAAWDPMLAWAERTHAAPLRTTNGIVPIAQPPESLARLTARVTACTPFQLTALHDLVSLSGSLVLGLAATTLEHDLEALWQLSRFDEIWQARLWGEDEEAAEFAELKRIDFHRAGQFWKFCSG